jgi:hypothetical protein
MMEQIIRDAIVEIQSGKWQMIGGYIDNKRWEVYRDRHDNTIWSNVCEVDNFSRPIESTLIRTKLT